MKNTTKALPTWIFAIIIGLSFYGYRVITGRSITRDLIDGKIGRTTSRVNPNTINDSSTKSKHEQDESLPTEDYKNGIGIRALKEQAIGFLAQTICSARVNNHTPEYSAQKIQFFIEAKNAEALRTWMFEPKVANVASILSLAFNSNCTSLNTESVNARRAFMMMDQL